MFPKLAPNEFFGTCAIHVDDLFICSNPSFLFRRVFGDFALDILIDYCHIKICILTE